MKKAFTLTEFLVVIAVVGILSVIIFPYYSSARKQLALERSASQLAMDIRKVQGMTLSAEEVGGSVPAGGFGIYLKKVPASQIHKSYILFADENDDKKYNTGEEIEDDIFFEEGIKILDLDNPHVNIIFKPPKPETFLTDNNGNDLGGAQTEIKISLISDESKTKTIIVNKTGLISTK